MIHGSCLCGSIKYEISGNIESIGKCDCVDCKKMTGSEFSANALIKQDNFHWIEGEKNIAVYQVSEEVSRTFCSVCGSNLQYIANKYPEIIGVALGTLDEDTANTSPKLYHLRISQTQIYQKLLR